MLASAELGEADDADKRPTVQVGDPFEEKKLLECSLELLDRGLLVALQDLGAAGLTSSASEMASKGGVGVDLDVARVPLREADMEPFEIMVSESQERMLCVVEPARVDEVLAVCAKWEVHGTAIGEVTDTRAHARAARRRGRRRHAGRGARRRLPALRPRARSARRAPIYPAARGDARRRAPRRATRCSRCSAAPNIASRRPLFEQYDCRSCSRARCAAPRRPTRPCSRCPDGDARSRVSIDGNGRRVAADPYTGHGRGRARVRGEPRLRRRRAARPRRTA